MDHTQWFFSSFQLTKLSVHLYMKHFFKISCMRIVMVFICDICCSPQKNVFKKKSHLKDHIELIHLLVGSRKCIKCHSEFKQMCNFVAHFKKLHLKCKNINCTSKVTCGKCASTLKSSKSEWKKSKPLAVNVKEANYECVSCDISFTTKSHLKSHNNLKHSHPTDPKKCTECDKKYAQQSNFVVHFKKNHICEKNKCCPKKPCKMCEQKLVAAKRSWNRGQRARKTNINDGSKCTCRLLCDENCVNRSIEVECDPEICILNANCTNTVIQKSNVPLVERFETPDKGTGVRSIEAIEKGAYIMEYNGDVITQEQYDHRIKTTYKNLHHHYGMQLEGHLIIDGYTGTNLSKYLNHSCEPNCVIEKWTVCGKSKMAIFANQQIAAQEELTFDYKFFVFESKYPQVCKCGTSSCRGTITSKTHLKNKKRNLG